MQISNIITDTSIKGTKGKVFGGKGFILRDTEKEVKFPSGFEPPIHGLRSDLSATELSDSLMSGHKSSVRYIKFRIVCLQINRSSLHNCHKMTMTQMKH